MNISDSLKYHLPEIKIKIPKNEVDLYGLVIYLSGKLKLGYNTVSPLGFMDGFLMNSYKEQFNTAQYSPHLKIVANLSQKKFLEEQGFKRLLQGIPMFTRSNENIKRFKNSILIMPPKNSIILLAK